jgi:glycine oxidase
LYPWHYPQAVVALARWSRKPPRLTAALLRETGIDPQWTQSGLLILDTEEQAEALGWARDSEVTLELIGRETVTRLEPGLEDPPEGALWMSQVAQVRNPRLVRALKQSLLGSEVPILENTEVRGFVGERGRIIGVETSAGERRAEVIVVASGAWTGPLLQTLGMNLPIEPVRGQMIPFRATPGPYRHPVAS